MEALPYKNLRVLDGLCVLRGQVLNAGHTEERAGRDPPRGFGVYYVPQWGRILWPPSHWSNFRGAVCWLTIPPAPPRVVFCVWMTACSTSSTAGVSTGKITN